VSCNLIAVCRSALAMPHPHLQAHQRMQVLASQIHESETSRMALRDQVLQCQPHAQQQAVMAPEADSALTSGPAPNQLLAAPAALLASPVDGRLDATATSTLIWGAEGVAALPFASPAGSPAVTHRSHTAAADADAAPGAAGRDQGAMGVSIAAGVDGGNDKGSGAPSSTEAAEDATPGAANGAAQASPGDASFASAASVSLSAQVAGGALTPPGSVSWPAFPGFSTPMSRVPSSTGSARPAASPSSGALGMLSAMCDGITPRRLLPSPHGAARAEDSPLRSARGSPTAAGGLAELLGGTASASRPRAAAADSQEEGHLDGLAACPLLSPVRASELGADAVRGSPLAAGLSPLRRVPALWGRPDCGEEGAAAVAAAAVRLVMAGRTEDSVQGADSDDDARSDGPLASEAAGSEAGSAEAEEVQQVQQAGARAAGMASQQQQPRRRRRGRRLVKLLVAASLVGAGGIAARRLRPETVQVAREQAERAWVASQRVCRVAWRRLRASKGVQAVLTRWQSRRRSVQGTAPSIGKQEQVEAVVPQGQTAATEGGA
jgi:hypothetical protein